MSECNKKRLDCIQTQALRIASGAARCTANAGRHGNNLATWLLISNEHTVIVIESYNCISSVMQLDTKWWK